MFICVSKKVIKFGKNFHIFVFLLDLGCELIDRWLDRDEQDPEQYQLKWVMYMHHLTSEKVINVKIIPGAKMYDVEFHLSGLVHEIPYLSQYSVAWAALRVAQKFYIRFQTLK